MYGMDPELPVPWKMNWTFPERCVTGVAITAKAVPSVSRVDDSKRGMLASLTVTYSSRIDMRRSQDIDTMPLLCGNRSIRPSWK